MPMNREPVIKNPELLKLAVKNIEAEQEVWNQSNWGQGIVSTETVTVAQGSTVRYICQTSMCLAGHVAVLAGYRFVVGLGYAQPGEETCTGSCISPDGELHGIAEAAREALGLDPYIADVLFYNMTDDINSFKCDITRLTGVEFE